MTENTFIGWTCTGKGKLLTQMEHPMRPWDENSIELEITHCGICGSDIHTLGKQKKKKKPPASVLLKKTITFTFV